MRPVRTSRGSVLIIVVGLSMLLLGLTTAFIARVRADAEAARALLAEAQTRTLVAAACTYVLETGRIGWSEEAYGWCDIRDDSDPNALPGPRGRDGRQLPKRADGSWAVDPLAPPLLRWPAIGGIARCPMFLPSLPPYATKGVYAYNPVPRRRYVMSGANQDPEATGYPDEFSIGLRYNALSPQPAAFPEPEPAGAWRWDDLPDGHSGALAAFAAGGRVVATDPASLLSAPGTQFGWFRVLRLSVDTFVVSAGNGASRGYRTWQEVVQAGEQAVFYNTPSLFQGIVAADRPLWYEVQWSASVGGRGSGQYAGNIGPSDNGSFSSTNGAWKDQRLAGPHPGYELIPGGLVVGGTYMDHMPDSMVLCSSLSYRTGGSRVSQGTNQLGTLSMIRRLFAEPVLW